MAKVARQSKRPRKVWPRAEELTLASRDMTIVLTADTVAVHAKSPHSRTNYQFILDGIIVAEVKLNWNTPDYVRLHNQITGWLNSRK